MSVRAFQMCNPTDMESVDTRARARQQYNIKATLNVNYFKSPIHKNII